MFDNLETGGVAELSEDELDVMMGTSKKVEKKESTKVDLKKDADKKSSKQSQKSSKDKSDLGSSKKATLSPVSSNDLDKAFGGDDDDEENAEEKEEEEEEDEDIEDKKKKKEDTKEEEEEDAEEKEEEEEDAEEKEEEEEDAEEAQIKNFIKARAELLIKKGEWADWDGSDKVEWDEEKFAEVELQQREYQRGKIREEVLDNFGPYGREIAKFAENGGDPDELIDIFKEQQRAESISLDSEENKKEAIFRYETEFLGKKPASVRRYIDSLIAEKALDEEATEAKDKMETHWKDEAERIVTEQVETVKEQKAKQLQDINKFSSKVSELLTADKNIPEDEKKSLLKALTKFDKKLPNGTPVNDFYFKFAEFRKSLPDYINLVRYVLDPKKFEKAIETNGKNKAVDKAFSLARTSNRSKKTRSGSIPDQSRSTKKSGFKLLY